MYEFTEYEKEIFCKSAKTIVKKGHLTFKALLKFIGSQNHKKDLKILRLLVQLELLTKHRTDTYELTSKGRLFAIGECGWFRERYGMFP